MLVSLFKFLIRAYQIFLSPLLGAACRFYPSCSNYALECIEHGGVLRGTYCALHRLIRCSPLSKGGYDPVKKHEFGE